MSLFYTSSDDRTLETNTEGAANTGGVLHAPLPQ